MPSLLRIDELPERGGGPAGDADGAAQRAEVVGADLDVDLGPLSGDGELEHDPGAVGGPRAGLRGDLTILRLPRLAAGVPQPGGAWRRGVGRYGHLQARVTQAAREPLITDPDQLPGRAGPAERPGPGQPGERGGQDQRERGPAQPLPVRRPPLAAGLLEPPLLLAQLQVSHVIRSRTSMGCPPRSDPKPGVEETIGDALHGCREVAEVATSGKPSPREGVVRGEVDDAGQGEQGEGEEGGEQEPGDRVPEVEGPGTGPGAGVHQEGGVTPVGVDRAGEEPVAVVVALLDP